MTKIAVTALAALHLATILWHGDAHTILAIDLPPAKDAFVYVVILIAPVVAAGLLWTRHVSVGLSLFLAAMVGALLFGAYHHYVFVSPDNIGHLPPGSPQSQSQFIASAATIALLELASALCGAFALGRHRATSNPRARAGY